jgi:hypothetical protein
MLPVTYINPCAAYDAVTSYQRDPYCNCKDDVSPCIQPVQFRGGFSPYHNWLESWSAVDAYGMTDTAMNTATDTTSTIVPDDGDLDNDMDTDLVDFSKLANSWLERE